MVRFLSHTNDFLVSLFNLAQRYIFTATSLLRRGALDFDQTVVKVRTKIYELYNQVYELLQPLERRLSRFNHQVLASLSVNECSLICKTKSS